MKALNRELKFKTFKTFKNCILSDIFPYAHSCSYACCLDLTNAYYHLGIADSWKNSWPSNLEIRPMTECCAFWPLRSSLPVLKSN